MVTQWTVKKEVTLGDLVAIGSAFLGVVFAYATLDKRISVIEEQYINQRRIDGRQDEDMTNLKKELRDDIQAIRAAIERLAYREKLRAIP